MTEQQALAAEDLAVRPAADEDPGAGAACQSEDAVGYDACDGGSYEGDFDWDDFPPPRAPQRPAPPWHRRPRLLSMLIATAAAVFVMATALLVTSRFAGEIPTRSQLGTRTASPAPSADPGGSESPATGSAAPASSDPASAGSPASASAPSAATSAAPTEDVAGDQAPQEAVQPAEALPSSAPPPPAGPEPASREKPQINVTRNPMSFTPGKP